MKKIPFYILIAVSASAIILCLVFIVWGYLFYQPANQAYRTVQKDEIFQAFEKQYPGVVKEKLYGRNYVIRYHVQLKDSEFALATDSYKRLYLSCEGSQLESEPVKNITPDEFKIMIQDEAICTPGIYQGWEIKE